MILNKYEIFLKTAEIGNITRAAEVLHYTQAGVSHAIAAMEREAGFPLFIRNKNGVELTENGKLLLPSVQTFVNDQRKVAEKIHEINHVMAGTIRVGTFTSVSVNWLPLIIKKFNACYPDVEFELLAGDYNEIKKRIRNGKIDCGFLTSPVERDLFFQTLYYDQMMAVLPCDHPLAARSSVSFSDIQNESFIMPMKGSDQDILNLLRENNIRVNIRYTLNDDFSVISLAEHGFGITIMSEMVLKHFETETVHVPFNPPQFRRVGIASPPLEKVSFLTKTFIQFISDGKNIDLTELI